VTGRLTESLGGVRVVKGYHAEESEAKVFAAGVTAAAGERDQLADGAVADDAGVDGGAGRGGRPGDVLGAHEIGGPAEYGRIREYTMLLAFMIAPIVQLVNIGTQLTEALAGLDRTTEILNERKRIRSRRGRKAGPIRGRCGVRGCGV
jgi:ABC-type multidrug transport system fused ATPase/permease subunit